MTKIKFVVSSFLVISLQVVHLARGQQSCGIHSDNGKIVTSGQCVLMKNCPAVLSDYKAGVRPTVCEQKGNSVIVCCPKYPRISEKKCEEYTKLASEQEYPQPYLPLAFQPLQASTPKPRGRRKCPVEPQGFIVNGRNAQPYEFPYMVALGYKAPNDNIWACGGTLISDDFVLTAAHCINNSQLGIPRRVFYGDLYLQHGNGTSVTSSSSSKRQKVTAIQRIYVHPQYRHPKKYNDLALVQLKSKVKFSPGVRPACLPSPIEQLETAENVTAIGWGMKGLGEAQAEVLQAAQLKRVNRASCDASYSRKRREKLQGWPQGILKSQTCAGHEKRDTCSGDSGGPIIVKLERPICKEYVVGVTSFGSLYCGYGEPGVYTNVQSYLDWIEDVVWPDLA